MRSTNALLLAALSIGQAMAGPTHAHLHRHAHEKKDVNWSKLDWNNMGIDWASAYAAGQATKTAGHNTAAAAPTTPPAAAAPASSSAPAPAPASTGSSSSLALFNGVVGVSNHLTAFGGSSASSGSAGDFYVGNVGSPYGSNIIKVSSRDGYTYTNEFINTQSVPITVNIWNKVGPDGEPLSGSSLAPKSTTLTFALAPGASQIVAFAEDSQVGWAESCDSIAASGAFATSWGEANFHSSGCGYDMSAIMNPSGNGYNMAISSVEASCTSDMTQNYWLTATQPIGNSDGSCYIAQGSATITTHMGGNV